MPDTSNVDLTVKQFVLKEFLPGETADNLKADTPLIETGILDSLSTIKLVAFLEETFGVTVEPHELNPENLGTLQDISRMVARKLHTTN